jgi:SAM-dependent methyltransferase
MDREQHLEGDFYHYMHQSGEVDPGWNRGVLSHYVPYFAQCGSVLDVGCGQGDFLELLQAAGVEGIGVDVDVEMVDICLRKGLHAVQADMFDYLPERKERFDGVFSSNLIEHLSAEEAMRFVRLAFDSLTPGGVFLVATPNPASPIVHLHEFWRDATHVRLYNGSLLEFLLDFAGFSEVGSDDNPVTAWEPPKALRKVPGLFQELASLRGAVHWDVKTERFTSLGPPATGSSSEGEGGLANQADTWSRRRDRLLTESQRASFLGRFVLSVRRRLACFLVDTILFEEFAALRAALTDLTQALKRTSNGLSDVNQTLSKRFPTLARMSVTTQEIEKALYHSHRSTMTTPREVFARGVKPVPKGQEIE